MPKNEKDQSQLIQVGSMQAYHTFRNIIVDGKNKFDLNPPFEHWPMVTIESRNVKGVVNVRPDPDVVGEYLNPNELEMWQSKMRKYIMAMNDLTADVLDMVTYKWLTTCKHPEHMVTVTADELLKLRGLQPQKSSGRTKKDGSVVRGGFSIEKKELIKQHINILRSTWIDIREMELPTEENGKRLLKKFKARSTAIVVSSIIDEIADDGKEIPYAWRVRPGDVFAPFLLDRAARQTAWMSQMALKFDPYREKWEKRLTRYFAYQWRVRHNTGNFLAPIKVNTLLENAVQDEVDPKNPSRTKKRLENSLNNLRKNRVIKDWKYIDGDEQIVGQKGWWQNIVGGWQQWKIEVTPPTELLEAYSELATAANAVSKSNASTTVSQSSIGGNIRKVREQNNLTLEQVCKEIEEVTGHVINVSTISRIENAESKPRKKTQAIIEQWLKRYDV
ncbi:helix-turn-helix transcriptional regulator [Thermoactinomyces sp. CICC 10522]|uniref:helix-turn-helix domain-containing protein n=1 Tax=Thermoactinomyces sp. CICC 10522 TaxID=2767427 RepID=UPI0018DD5273|nr:helix-turn-helix transcriptional regulator [Thermoactinomyces sp. CICC 10522]